MSSGELHSWYSSSRASRKSSRPTLHPPCCPHRLTRPWGHKHRKEEVSHWQLIWLFLRTVTYFVALYLKHLIESWAAAGDGVRGPRQRFQVPLTHVFELQHDFLTTDNLRERHVFGPSDRRFVINCTMKVVWGYEQTNKKKTGATKCQQYVPLAC